MTYLFLAYSLIWIILFGYILRLRSKQVKLTDEVQRLHSQLEEIKKPQ